MDYFEAFALKNKYKDLVTGQSIHMLDADGKQLKITDVIVTPYGCLNKVCTLMHKNSLSNEDALLYMQKNNGVLTAYVVNTDEATLLHINLFKYLISTNQLSVI